MDEVSCACYMPTCVFTDVITGGAQNIKLKPKEKKTTEDGASDKVKGKGGFRGFRGFM